MGNIAVCPSCGAKNRLGKPPEGQVPRCGRCQDLLPWLVDGGDADPSVLSAPVPVLLDLWAPWCGPCLAMAPVLEDVAKQLAGNLKVVKINVDENPLAKQRFGASSIPLLVVLKDGEVAEKVVGVQTRRRLREIVNPYL